VTTTLTTFSIIALPVLTVENARLPFVDWLIADMQRQRPDWLCRAGFVLIAYALAWSAAT
jgi:hypothetical protein